MKNNRKNHIREGFSGILFDTIKYLLVITLALVCLLPFIVIVSGSLSDNATVMKEGYGLLPKNFSTAAYEYIFRSPDGILQAYKMTIYYTFVGTFVGLITIVMTAYVVSRSAFEYRNTVSFLIYFTTIFGGGMIPWYLMYTNVLGLKGSTLVIWLPGIMSSFLIILMRTFIKGSVPDAITEAAKIDGAGDGTTLLRIVMPVLKPGLATVGLFLALGYWNDWYRSSLFATDKSMYELQFYLYNLVNASEALKQLSAVAATVSFDIEVPSQTVKMAMAIVVTGPVLLFYPFVQKYFVSGITIGAVKG